MQFYGPFALFLCIIVEVRSVQRITLDDDAQALCKKYKMMCKTNKICAVQHFDWPNNITIPVCIPLSFVPVRNMICQLPPDIGRCHARYIRWYFNIHSQECNHFQYGGCEGNQNNFMSKTDCERTCIAAPSIKLYEGGGNSALVQPSILTAPIYEPPKTNQYEALNSVMEPADNFDRYALARHRPNRVRSDEATKRTRRRLDKEEKEKRRERRKKERRRMRKLQKKEQKKLRCKKRRERGKKCKKDRKSKKDKKKNILEKKDVADDKAIDKNNVVSEDTNQVAKETQKVVSNGIEVTEEDEKRPKETKRERRRRKRKLKEKRRLEKERKRRNLNSKYPRRYSELVRKPDSYSAKLFSILDQDRQQKEQKNSLLHTLS